MKHRWTKYFITLLGVLIFIETHAQLDALNGRSISDIISIKNSEAFIKSADIEGSPYADDSFKLGKVYTTNGIFNGVPLRHDLYNGWIEFKEKSKRLILSPEPNIIKIEIDTTVLFTQPFYKDGKITLGFFNKVYDHKVILLKQQSVKFIEKPPAKALELTSTPASFTKEPVRFFIRFDNTVAEPIYSTKKLISIFPDHQKELASFVKEKNIKIKQDDLKSLMAYYSSLSE